MLELSMNRSALIIGAGSGLSSSLALQCAHLGMDVALAARNVEKLEDLSIQTKASLHKCDASKIEDVNRLFKDLDEKIGIPELVIYNPSARLRGAIEALDPEKTKEALDVTCFGAFLVVAPPPKPMHFYSAREIEDKFWQFHLDQACHNLRCLFYLIVHLILFRHQ